jgi:phenylacetic acid degradation operon negative regulatory protein
MSYMDIPVSNYIYSSFSFFASQRGGELPGRWFVEALAAVGCDESAVRQTLYRMERSGELLARRSGREKHYRPTGYAQGEIAAGTQKIFGASEPWDGCWTLVHAPLERKDRVHRQRLESLLGVEGFATIRAGVHIHPRDRGQRIAAAVDEGVRDQILILRGRRQTDESDARFVLRHWDVPAIAHRYRAAIRELVHLEQRAAHPLLDIEAFRLRFEVVIRFLRVAWGDPDLPLELLPEGWPGENARELAAELYRTFLPGATRFGDHVLEQIGHGDIVSVERAP